MPREVTGAHYKTLIKRDLRNSKTGSLGQVRGFSNTGSDREGDSAKVLDTQ
jgi:hypothetical protein